jgi:HD-like signal output (HDOD) protein
LFHKSSDFIALPSMPGTLMRVIELTRCPDATIERLAEVVIMDQSLTARVLKLANSVCYARRQKSETVFEAIVRLGTAQLRNLAASAAVLDAVLPSRAYPGFDWREMWNHSVICAVASEAVSSCAQGKPRQSDGAIFISGLLHDVGKMIIASALPKRFLQIIATCMESGVEMLVAERKHTSTTHAIVGSQLAMAWELPETLAAGISYHHGPDAAPEHEHIARAVHAGNLIAKRLGRCYIMGTQWRVSIADIAEAAKLQPQEVEFVIAETRAGVTRCGEILSWGNLLPVPTKAAA